MNSNLILNVDYYLEDGNMVFTREYHLKRGHCCQSGCRHCPYEYKGKNDPNTPSEYQSNWSDDDDQVNDDSYDDMD